MSTVEAMGEKNVTKQNKRVMIKRLETIKDNIVCRGIDYKVVSS